MSDFNPTDHPRRDDGKFAAKEGSRADIALPPSVKPLRPGQSAQMAHGTSENLGVNKWLEDNRVVGVITYVGKFRGGLSAAQDKREYDVTIAANGRSLTTRFFSDEEVAPTVADVLYSFAEDAENANLTAPPRSDLDRIILGNRLKLKEFLGADFDDVAEGERVW